MLTWALSWFLKSNQKSGVEPISVESIVALYLITGFGDVMIVLAIASMFPG